MLKLLTCTILDGFELNQQHRTFTIWTRKPDSGRDTRYRVVFVDVLAARIASIPDPDTRISIHEVSLDRAWQDGESIFLSHNGENWPKRFRCREDFLRKARSKFLHAFEIISDSGTAGWIISNDPIITFENIPAG